jgi:hypothetical protein
MLWLLIGGCRIPSSVLNVSRFVFGGTSTSIHVSFLFLFNRRRHVFFCFVSCFVLLEHWPY